MNGIITCMLLNRANELATQLGYEDWTGPPDKRTAALMQAALYIRGTYPRLRQPDASNPAEVADYEAGFLLVAIYRLGKTGEALPTASVKRSKEDIGGLVIDVEYNDAPTDPLPLVTGLFQQFQPAQGVDWANGGRAL